jgi:eukaryotic-like serine/threonine-protein kinase
MAGFISDLKLGARLGNGHFGEVFQGEDPAHGQVAVKVLKREVFHDDAIWPEYKAGYLAEAKSLAKASHRNVVQVHHVVEAPDGDSVMICMAFCPGGSLQSAFDRGPMTSPPYARSAQRPLWAWAPCIRAAWSIVTSNLRTSCSTARQRRR